MLKDQAKTFKFDGDDYRDLIDVLIEACRFPSLRLRTPAPQIEIAGKCLSLEEAATLVTEIIGYDTPLLPHHAKAVKSAGYWGKYRDRPEGYGRAAHALVLRYNDDCMPAFAATGTLQRHKETVHALEVAHREVSSNIANTVQIAAMEAHPAWTEVGGEVLIVDGRAFVKSGAGPSTAKGLVAWFRKQHGDEVERIEKSVREARRAEMLRQHDQLGRRSSATQFSPKVAELVALAESKER